MSVGASFGGRRALAWALPLLVVTANVVWLLAFGSGRRVRETDMARQLERAHLEHDEVAVGLAAREALWVAATENGERARKLERERFATERTRFTDMVRELKDLAERAGLDPGSISYPREALEEYGLTRRSFVFAIQGSYASLRTFLNLVELSPSFLTLEQIDVDLDRSDLSVRLRLSTLFGVATEAPPAGATPALTTAEAGK